ncbi:hypothetical protein Tco_1441218 [Tanacetum coccineum]
MALIARYGIMIPQPITHSEHTTNPKIKQPVRCIVTVQLSLGEMIQNYAGKVPGNAGNRYSIEMAAGNGLNNCRLDNKAKAVLMANLSSYNSDILSEVPCTEYYQPELIYDHVQEMQYSEQPHIDETIDNEITRDSNIIPYSQYLHNMICW